MCDLVGVSMWVQTHVYLEAKGWLLGCWFSSTTSCLGIECSSSGLVVGTFTTEPSW